MSDGARWSRRAVLLAGIGVAATACTSRIDGAGRPAAAPPDIPVRLTTRWDGKPDGPLPATGDEGVPIVVALAATTAEPTVQDGALVSNLPASSAGAAYVQQDLGRPVTRIGARFGFGPGSASGSLALIAFNRTDPPTAHCHMVFAPDRWIAGIVTEDGVVEVTTRPYRSAVPQDGSEVEADVRFAGTTAWVTAPDGTVTTLDDPRFTPTGAAACWEFYKNDPTAADVRLYETWAG
ncbi:hypothetical protein [Blastococcus sp. URHD0036]|uniref:hypothetical protein n=1 Tax=Blastococcus sp. URHD0036 TaxID=1380356 RepID=UPI0004954826|nr:hypothetical protein [Blastococcus sp. URHD0036]